MKRFLSLLLVVVLLAAAIPTAALANRTSSISITFEAFDSDRDKAFRSWAGNITNYYIEVYTKEYLNDLLNEAIAVMQKYSADNTYQRTGWGSDDYEYDPYSLNYEALYTENPEQAEELLELAYLEQLSESIQTHASKLKLEGFDSRDTGKWLSIDTTTGQWTYDYQLEAVTKMEQNKLVENTLDTALKAIDGAVKVYNLSIVKGTDANKTFNSLWDSAMTAAPKIVDDIYEYLNKELQEQMTASLKNDIVNNILFADDAAITYLRKTYVESANYTLKGTTEITEQDIIFPAQRKQEIFKKAVDKLLSAYEAQKTEAPSIAAEIISGTKSFTVDDLKAKCDSRKITYIVTLELLRSAIKLAFDGAKENFNMKGWKGNESKFGKENTSIGWLGSSLYDALYAAVGTTCDLLIDKAINGEDITWSGWWDEYKKSALKTLTGVFNNISNETMKNYTTFWEKTDEKKGVAAEVSEIVVDLMSIGADLMNGKEITEIATRLESVIWKAITYIATHIAIDKATTYLTNTSKIAETLKTSVSEFLKAIDPAKWADVGVGIVNTARALHDAKGGNAASNYTAFKMYQIWEVGSHGIQRGVAGFPSYEDATNPNKITADYLTQKVSQILQQLNTESTCISELLQILSTKSDLKKAVVEHFKEKGMKEVYLTQKLLDQYTTIRRLYDAWSEQQTTRFPEYFN